MKTRLGSASSFLARVGPFAATSAPLAALLLAGCSDGVDGSSATPFGVATFSPSTGEVPVPSDLLLSGSEDLTLNIPVSDALDYSDPQVALNALDGWSPSAPFTLGFSRAVDAATFVEESTVRFFEVTLDTAVAPVGGPVNGITRELSDAEYDIIPATEDATGATLRILLNQPLAPSTSYMIVVTNGATDDLGRPLARDTTYEFASSPDLFPQNHPLATLQGLILSQQGFAAAAGVAPETIVLSNVFTTQSIGSVLGSLATVAGGGETIVIDRLCATGLLDCQDTTPAIAPAVVVIDGFIGTTAAFVPGSPGVADVYEGRVTLPYFLTAASNTSATDPTNDTAPLNEFWRARYPFLRPSGPDTERNLTVANSLPAMTGTEEVPLLVMVPNAVVKPGSGWPTVIFQHGVTRDRSDALAVADALCGAGFAVMSIDLPLHGIVDAANPLFKGFLEGGQRERTFGLDLADNATGAPGPDGVADLSGQHFINLANLLVTRDNLRQGSSDLLHLRQLVFGIDVDGGGSDLDDSNVSFLGFSLGAIVGTPYLALQDASAATLAMPGVGLPKLLVESASFGPPLLAGLAANGVVQGTPEFESFLFAAQTATDAGDPVNYASTVSGRGTPIHVIEVIGDGAANLPDQTIPNSVPEAPLSGTDPQIAIMGLQLVGASITAPSGVLQVAVQFIEGEHGSLIDPTPSAAATTEMQSEVVSFFLSGGTSLTIADQSVVQVQSAP